MSLAFSSNGKSLAAGDAGGAITIWDVKSKLPIQTCLGTHHRVFALAFSPDGTLLAVATADRIVRLWDLRAIHERLGGMGLDWDMPRYPPLANRTQTASADTPMGQSEK